MDNREAIEWLKGCVVAYEVDNKGKPNGNVTCELIQEVIDMAITALEKQEQSNAQNFNSTHRSCPNALESLNILEQAKDDKGNVPMSLVRQAFRNVMEQDRWNPCSEKMPAEPFGCFVTVMDTNPITQEEFENILPYFVGWDGEQWNDADGERIPCEVLAWRPLPKPYKLEKKS